MKVTKGLVEHVLNTSGKAPEQIASGIAFYENIENSIKIAKQKQRELKIQFDTQHKVWEDKISEAKKKCDHPAFAVSQHTEYEDRWRECGICGKNF